MSETEPLLFSLLDGVARIVLNRPDKLNAFTLGMHRAFASALDQAEAGNTRVLLLTGAGKGFCAGQDLSERDVESGVELDLGSNIENHYNPLVRRLLALPFPVVCAVNGVAAGAGANLALLCDVVVARESARFIQSFARIGLLPDTGGTWMLPHLVGQARGLALALTGDPINAAQAAEWGMIWKCVSDDAFDAEVERVVTQFANAPTAALVEIKRAVRRAWTADLLDQLDQERDAQRRLGRTSDYAEGVCAFKAKRAPIFTGK